VSHIAAEGGCGCLEVLHLSFCDPLRRYGVHHRRTVQPGCHLSHAQAYVLFRRLQDRTPLTIDSNVACMPSHRDQGHADFPILGARTISWLPVERVNGQRYKAPRGSAISGNAWRRPAHRRSYASAKWGISTKQRDLKRTLASLSCGYRCQFPPVGAAPCSTPSPATF
jgi:hypothetical protein